jgi:hypothetical protein
MNEEEARTIINSSEKVYSILEAKACQFLYEKYGSNKKASESVKISDSRLGENRRLLTLPEYIQKLISQKSIPKKAGIILLKLLKLKDEEALSLLTWKIVDKELSYKELRGIVSEFEKNNGSKTIQKILDEFGIKSKKAILGIAIDEIDYCKLRKIGLLLKESTTAEELCQWVIRKWIPGYQAQEKIEGKNVLMVMEKIMEIYDI